MKKLLSTSMALLFGVSLLINAASANAAERNTRLVQQRNEHVANFCGRNPSARSCNDWSRNHSSWSDQNYRNFYRSNRYRRDFNGNDVGAMFMFSIGSAIGDRGYVRGRSSHVKECQARYRSYQVRTDSYLGYDGNWHRCNS
jgi:hypothetical protein